MPRDIPLGNGKLLICFDDNHQMRDLYYPHVGQENHLGGSYSRLGIWLDNQFSWINRTNGWSITQQFETDTLVSRIIIEHYGLHVRIMFREAVDFTEDVFCSIRCLRSAIFLYRSALSATRSAGE